MNLSTPVALAKTMVLLLLIRCLLLLPLWDSVIVVCFLVRYFISILLDGKERAGCFTLFVFLVSCDCFVALSHDATGLSAVCYCGI